MRIWFGLLFGLVLVAFAASGCGPSVTEEELGTVVYEVSELPGADQPYELPEQAYPPKGEDGPHHEEE